MATATLGQLRGNYPEAQIYVLCIPWVKQVWENNPCLAGIISYDPGQAKCRLKAGLKDKLAGKFDLAILLPNSLHTAWLTFLAGIPLRVGYNRDARFPLLTHAMPRDFGQPCHQVEYYLNILKYMGWPVRPPQLCWTITREEQDWAGRYLAQIAPGHSNWLAVHPGSSKLPRCWHSGRFAGLTRRIIQQHQFKVLLLGSRGELGLLQEIQREAGQDDCYIPEGLDLCQVAALIRHCRLFIGNDSGLMHIASAVDTPVVGIFGPGAPQITGPYMDKSRCRTVLHEVPCRPCRQRFFRECKPSESGKPPCLEAVTVEDVSRAVEELL